jgi:hypothetical protein
MSRVKSGESVFVVYSNDSSLILFDKATTYDAEHDSEPATVEWLREVLGEPEVSSRCGDFLSWRNGIWRLYTNVGLRFEYGGELRASDVPMDFTISNPTRGQVLKLLSVFGEGE